MKLREGIVRRPERGVRHGVVEIDEEGARIISFNECGSLFRKKIVDVIAFDIGAHALAVAPEMIGELPMRMAVIEEPERVIEPLSVRLASRARLAEPPLPVTSRRETASTKTPAHRQAFRR